ncbi:M23 family metallopeptidase [Actinomyces procaprae]|uniref:M23 family metallopeptidase n=1 Tax=Actinomyces procaprae TaxID=2560010 RepID=UPI001FF75188|nr:M23 family metallopeptidase [Actinomyces procaprae]
MSNLTTADAAATVTPCTAPNMTTTRAGRDTSTPTAPADDAHCPGDPACTTPRRPPAPPRWKRSLIGGCATLAACAALVLAPVPALAGTGPHPPSASARQAATAWRGGYGDPNPLRSFAVGTAAEPGASLPGTVTTRVRYGWPSGAATTVLADFDPPAVVWGSGHRGVDLALAAGSQVLAAADGTVAFAGMVAGRPVVSIDHADGIRTTYEPVEPCVEAGEAVTRGQVIGTLQAGHRTDGADALHWGARTGPKTYVNPLRLLQPAVIRLKPLS